MKIASLFFTFFYFACILVGNDDRAVLVHNTLQEIENSKGKLQLKLIRVWGGDEEEDEHKFFETPSEMVIDKNQLIYICDWHGHCIKVFDNAGRYIRTIGRRGQGPGDLYGPRPIALTPEGDLLVFEEGGRRFQWFDSKGKSIHVFKYIDVPWWIGVTSRNEIAFYEPLETFRHRKLITVIDNKGKVLREFGRYHDRSKEFISSEKLKCSIDNSDNIYAANRGTPVIRKYSPDGKLLRVITFETPLNVPVKITLNSSGDEIERNEKVDSEDDVKIVDTGRGVNIQYNRKRKFKTGVCCSIEIDNKKRIYIVTRKRELTETELKGTAVSGNSSRLNRALVDFNVVENIDAHVLLVFDKNGKIIAQSQLTTFCDDLYIHNNRIFVVDGFFNQRVLEYAMTFKNNLE